MKAKNLKKADLRINKPDDKLKGKIHPSVLAKIFNGGTVNTDTINRLCKLLDCQPGDIMEYIDDEK